MVSPAMSPMGGQESPGKSLWEALTNAGVVIDVGDILYTYKRAVKGATDKWQGLELALGHFSGKQATAVLPSRHARGLPAQLKSEMLDVVTAPEGLSLELLESVAASTGLVLSNRRLSIGKACSQVYFAFSSQGQFFCFSRHLENLPTSCQNSRRKRHSIEHALLPRRAALASPLQFYIGSEAETDRPSSEAHRLRGRRLSACGYAQCTIAKSF
ncbi:unnamed protein product [Effrenium voratum]|nr:unnamed protein product [Effrenium voratum]